MLLPVLQRVLPPSVTNRLKPYYRTVFPNRLHVLLWVTFRCNYRCSYCPVVTKFDFGDVFPADTERTPDEWIAALQTLPPALVYISGGEPFAYKGLPELVNGLGKHDLLGIVTNGTAPTRIYDQIDRPVHLNVSFHREYADEATFLLKIAELQRRHQVQVNIVATPENLPLIAEIRASFTSRRVRLHVDPFVDPSFAYTPAQRAQLDALLESDRGAHVDRQLDYADYAEKVCSAGRNYLNLMPNGDVYACFGGMQYVHSPLMRPIVEAAPARPDLDAYRMGNLFDPAFRLNDRPIRCTLPCSSPCDFDAATIRRA